MGVIPILSAEASGPPFQFYLFVIVALVLASIAFWKAWLRKWEVDDTPTSTCRGVFFGRNEVDAPAQPTQPLSSPLDRVPCVWFQWHLERYQSNGKSSSWVTVEKRATAAPFWLQDPSGRVLVRPRGAEIEAHDSGDRRIDRNYAVPYTIWQLRQWTLVGEDQIERQQSMADAAFREQPGQGHWFHTDIGIPLHALSGRYRISEHVIPIGQPTYLLGDAQPRPEAPGLEFVAGDGHHLFLSDKSERAVSKSAGRSTFWLMLASLALSAVLALLVSTSATHHPRPWWAAVSLVAELAVLFVVYGTKVFNREVAVKEQAAKAWSMIDVSLRRRNDLLPNLGEVAAAYAAHEQATQESVAALRAGAVLPAAETLPSDAHLQAVQASDRAARTSAHTVFALAEAYPDLKANTVFLDLQRRITDTENLVASSRQFYNDAITVLRDRRQTFPGNLVAWMVKVPSWQLFEAEEAAAAPVAIHVDPVAADASPSTPPAGPHELPHAPPTPQL
ncbi:MAG TPA: LemA family protein [Acidimicrobiales bacterium]